MLRLTLFTIISGFILLAERLFLAGWRAFAWAAVFAALWLYRIPALAGNTVEILTLAVFAPGLGYWLWVGFHDFSFPSLRDVRRRMEIDSNVSHRPLSDMRDRPAYGGIDELWMKNRAALRQKLDLIRPARYRSFPADRDPYALRLITVAFLVTGLFVAGPQVGQRLLGGLWPVQLAKDGTAGDAMRASLIPPDYTGKAAIVLSNDDKGVLEVPQGSMLKAIVTDGFGKPVLFVDGERFDFESEDGKVFVKEMVLPEGAHFSIRQSFLPRGGWDYRVIPDTPPQIEFKGEAEVSADHMIRIPLSVQDDYGVQTLSMRMHLDPVVDQAPLGYPAREIRSVSSPAGAAHEIAPVYDLTAHPWAGLPAVITLSVEDALGQIAMLEPVSVVLPEREFRHPVARALITMRKKLAWEPEGDMLEASRELEEMLAYPDTFQNDLRVYLAIRTAASRLYWSPPSEDRARAVMALLWDTALAIEEGNLSLAMRNLRQVQNALERALQNPDTTPEELSGLMDELRQAMDEYLMELQKEMQMAQEGENPLIPPELLENIINSDALGAFLDQLEDEMRAGNTDKVQEMLSQLQEMMDMMSPGMMAEMPQDMQMMQEGVNELQELIGRQEDLLRQTGEQAEMSHTPREFGQTLPLNEELLKEWGLKAEDLPPAPPPTLPPFVDTHGNRAEQEALRIILGQLMLEAAEALEKVPENMGLAEQAMRRSSAALGENDPGGSIPHQETAIAELKKAQEDLSKQFMQRMKQMGGRLLLSRQGMQYDPLGRPYGGDENEGGMFPGSRVKIPNDAERNRALEILREIRRRSGQHDRPQEELDYFRRLLKQF